MTLTGLSVAFVAAVLLHNAEEALFLPAWSRHADRWYRPVGAWEFRFAAVVLSLVLIAIAWLAVALGPRSVGAYLFLGFVFAMAVNAIVPHLALTVVQRRYMPGTATGMLLNLPLGACVLREAVHQRWVAAGTLAWSAPVVAIALGSSLPLLLAAGRRVAPAHE